MRVTLLLILTLLMCTGCSTEPSEADLVKATHIQYDDFNSYTQKLMGRVAPESQFTVHSVKKINCKLTEPNGYSCDVEVDITAPGIGRYKSVKNIQLTAVESGWQTKNVF
jgi:hypothetical protein